MEVVMVSVSGERSHERRRVPRVSQTGIAVVHGEAWAVRALIVDLSTRGVRLRTEPRRDGRSHLEERVVVELRVSGTARRWVTLRGHVRRCRPLDRMLAIEFDALAHDLDDTTQDAIVRTLETAARPTVLLLDVDPDRRASLGAALAAAQLHVVPVGTPLEAISCLEHGRLDIRVIAIAPTVPVPVEDDLRRFVASAYPAVKIARASVPSVIASLATA